MTRIDIVAKLMGTGDQPLYGIEIGCLNGDFAVGILSKLKNLDLTSVEVAPRHDEIYKKLLGNNLAAEPKFKLLHTTSDEAIRFLRRTYDFVFIDACHSYEQTRKDILNYWQVIKPGGFIIGHNYEEGDATAHPGVFKAVKEIFGSLYSTGEDVTWWKQV